MRQQSKKTTNPYLARDEINRRRSMVNTVLPQPPVRAAFAATSISAQKIRFWKAIAVLVVACMCYVIYLNIYAFHGTLHRSSPDPSHLQPKASKPATTEAQPQQQKQQKHQKVRTSESPEKLKAVILKSIPHDTGAFTQVCTQPLSCILPLLT
jgi:hypothetical protein